MKEQLKQQIKEFLAKNEPTDSLSLDLGFPHLFIEVITSMGGDATEDTLESNGWQWDWWMTATLNGRELRISGSGCYGGASISWEES